MNGPMRREALYYAAVDRPVFPCNPRPGDYAKAPLIPKSEGGQGHKDATTDPNQIIAWWTRWPGALIGSPVPALLICVDIDPRSGATVAKLEKLVGELPDTQAVISGRGDGGIHLFFRRPVNGDTGEHMPISTAKLNKVIPGVDIKTSTGYTILPPSLHPDTRCPYEWRGDGLKHPVLGLPFRLADLLQAPPPRPPRPALCRRVAREATVRNKVLYWAAMRLVEGDYPEEAYDSLADAAHTAGLSQRETNKTINSARKALA